MIKAVAKADGSERKFWIRTIEKGDQQDGDLDEALRLIALHGTMEASRAEALSWVETAKNCDETAPGS